MKKLAEQVAYIAGLMFDRHLTDIAGGNVSAKDGDRIYITPRYAGSKKHWRLTYQDIISGLISTDEIIDNPAFSREGLSHLSVYRAYPEVKAIIHAHPPHVLAFCAIEKHIEPIINSAQKYGTLIYHDHAPSYSQEQADSIVEKLSGKEEMIKSAAAAVLMPLHGIFIAGKDLFQAVDALERINTNAWCLIAQKMIV